jgi:hypothetical protein
VDQQKGSIVTVTSKVASEDIQAVFDHWVTVCRPTHRVQPVLSDKRRKKIADAVKLYGVETCLQAVEGVTFSDFHMGANNRGKKYDDIELVLRDAAHIERFAELYHENKNRGSYLDD